MTLVVDGYDVGDLIGSGGHARVWAATDRRTGVEVALKHFTTVGPDARTAAIREASLLRSLDHPALVRCHDVLETGSGVILVLDLARGGSLARLLARRRLLTPAETAASLAPVAAALQHAHAAGVVHGDVSAANILFDADGRPMLADLGIATLAGDGRRVTGTPAYADPIVVRGGPALPASDVFGLAAVALHALSGLGPWQESADDPVEDVLARAGLARLPDLRLRLPDRCPEAVAQLLESALQPDPHRRPTAAAFALDLRAAAGSTTPVLGAGRARASGATYAGRHSATGRLVSSPGPVPDPGRPDFNRPGVVAEAGAPVPAEQTLLRRTRPRPSTEPVRRRRLRLRPGAGRRHSTAGRARRPGRRTVCAVAAGLLTAAAVVGFRVLPGTPTASASPEAVPRSVAGPSGLSASAATALRGLDEARSGAYAQRRPDALAGVYASPELLAADRGQLLRVVPAGCGLVGLHTTFTDVRAAGPSAGSAVRVHAHAVVSAAQVVCAGSVVSRLRSQPATDLSIVLRSAGDDGGLRIASVRTGDG